MVMIMVEVFSALFGRECDMVGRVHDSMIVLKMASSWHPGILPGSYAAVCGGLTKSGENSRPYYALALVSRWWMVAQLVLD